MAEKSNHFLVFSDLHAHPFKYGGKVDFIGKIEVQSRLKNAVLALDYMAKYAIKVDIKHILFCGDLFHVRGHVPVQAFNLISHVFALYKDIKWHLIPGNHDFADHGTIHALKILDMIPNVTVHDDFQYFSLESTVSLKPQICVHPVHYVDSKQVLKAKLDEAAFNATQIEKGKLGNSYSKNNLLIAHAGVMGATVGSDFVISSKDELDYTDLHPEAFGGVLLGHYHDHQKVGPRIWYVGATLQQDWSDANKYRGFLECWFDENHLLKFEKRSLDDLPGINMFRIVKDGDLCTGINSNTFVTFVTEKEYTTEMIHMLLGGKPAMLEVRHPKYLKQSVQAVIEDDEELESIPVFPSTLSILEAYYKNNPPVQKVLPNTLERGQGFVKAVFK